MDGRFIAEGKRVGKECGGRLSLDFPTAHASCGTCALEYLEECCAGCVESRYLLANLQFEPSPDDHRACVRGNRLGLYSGVGEVKSSLSTICSYFLQHFGNSGHRDSGGDSRR